MLKLMMRQTTTILLAAQLLFLARAGQAQQQTNAQPRVRPDQAHGTNIPVGIFFDGVRAVDPPDLRAEAWAALRSKGHVVPDSASCFINVTVAGPKAGCVVIFQELETAKYYQVEFNAKGEVSKAFAALARVHGDPYAGSTPPTMPEGGVPVKPETIQPGAARPR